jgi:hypothetical protein
MSTWTSEELDTLAAATELRISTRRADGTLRPAVRIWVVRAGDDIYVCLPRTRRGVVPKYGSFGRSYVDPMTAGPAATTTLQLTPQH